AASPSPLPPASTPTASAAPSAPPEASPTPLVETYTLTLEDQQEIFQNLWEIVRDEYLYEDYNGLDWEAIHTEYSARLQSGLSDQEFYFAMDEMLYRLGDDHSAFLSPEQAAEEDRAYTGNLDYVG